MELSADTQLIFHWIPILLGLVLMLPFGENLGKSVSEKWPSMGTNFGRTVNGMMLVIFGGFTVSAHTYWIHNKAKEIGTGDFCAGGGVWDCGSVIGNDDWNTMPFFDIPWGLVGMLVFSLFLWIVYSVSRDSSASWVPNYIYYSKLMCISGIAVIMYLIYAEFQIEKLCQYCTTAHVAHLITTFGFFKLGNMQKTSEWNSNINDEAINARKERRSRSRGYVAPTESDSEE